jgi:hypothetical protein
MFKKTAQFMLIAIAIVGVSRVPADGGGPVPLCTPDQHCPGQVDGNGPVPLCTPDQHCPGQP